MWDMNDPETKKRIESNRTRPAPGTSRIAKEMRSRGSSGRSGGKPNTEALEMVGDVVGSVIGAVIGGVFKGVGSIINQRKEHKKSIETKRVMEDNNPSGNIDATNVELTDDIYHAPTDSNINVNNLSLDEINSYILVYGEHTLGDIENVLREKLLDKMYDHDIPNPSSILDLILSNKPIPSKYEYAVDELLDNYRPVFKYLSKY